MHVVMNGAIKLSINSSFFVCATGRRVAIQQEQN